MEAAANFQPVSPEELNEMSQAGFSDDEVHDFRIKSMQEMAGAGFKQDEVEKYYGTLEPDMSATKDVIKGNLKAAKEKEAEKPNPDKPREAQSFLDAVEAGWGMSVTGLVRGRPDVVMPADAPRASRIASQVSQLAGDLPAMVAGWAGGATVGAPIGGAIGTAVGPVGTLGGIAVGANVGGAAGAFAAPAAMRKLLMDHYAKGDIKDFGDFWDRSSAAMWEAVKQGSVGAATGGAGVVAGKALGTMAPAIVGGGTAAAEIGTMVTVGKAIEGEMPNADDFIDAAIVVGGLHAVAKVGKFRAIYEKTGLKPEQVVEMAEKDPVMKQEIMSDNVPLPGALEKIAEDVPAKKAEQAPPPEITEAQSKILSKVGVKPEQQKKGYTKENFYEDFVDKYDPTKVLEEQALGKKESAALAVDESPYKLARLANDYKSKVVHLIEKGTIDFKTGETNGKGLSEIIEPHKADLNGLKAFLVADRAIEIEGSGRKSGFDLKAAEEVVKEGKAKYGKTAKEIVDFQGRVLDYLVDSGRLSEAARERMAAKGEKYIPFGRIMEEVESGGGGKGTLFKELKGGEQAIQDPFLSILENTEKAFKAAETNRAQVAAVEFAEMNSPESLSRVEGGEKRGLRKNEIEIWRDGEREVFTGDENLIRSLKALEGNAPVQNIVIKLARAFTAVKRIGITLTPDFIIKNGLRDFLTSSVFSKTSKNPFISAVDVVVAMGDLWKKNDHYYNWLKSGGANGAFLELDAAYLRKDVFKIEEQTGFIRKTQNAISSPIELLKLGGNLIESAPRLAEFKRTYKKTGSLREGGYASREITVDFQRIGAKMAAVNAITAFQNVSIQGLDRTYRAVKENPMAVGSKVAAYIVAPSVYLWWAQHDDPRYKEVPRWQKDLFWIVLTDKWEKATEEEAQGLPEHLVRETKGGLEVNRGTIQRYPKPQELGMVGSVVERLLEKYVGENPNAGKELNESIMQMLVPSLIPDIAVPPLEHATGSNFFTGRPLVPTYLEGQLPAYRYTEYTTETSKALGKLLGTVPVVQEKYGASPMVIENYVRGWTGTLGMYALQLSDAGLIKSGMVEDPVKPAMSLADIPAVKSFIVRYPSAQAQSIQDFYDEYGKASMVVKTLKDQLKKGNAEEVDFIMGEYDDQLKSLDGYKEALTKQSSFIHAVQRQKEWTPEEKRQMIETTYYQMIEISKQGLEMSREMEKALKEK